jgi:hypothetical protein
MQKILFSCRHDVEKLLRASGSYSLAWLRSERLAWHTDRLLRKCAPELREMFQERTTEMYSIFEELLTAETPKDQIRSE